MTPCLPLLISLLMNPPQVDAPIESDQPTVIVVQGAAGAPQFAPMFADWSARWEEVARRGNASFHVIGQAEEEKLTDREQLQNLLAEEATGSSELWLIYIGHGTYDYRSAKWNLRGPDVSATELAGWLKSCQRPTAIINCASASAPFLQALSGKNRVVVTATRSGFEQNFARFGDLISEAMLTPDSDLDKDGQTSLLEAWLVADRRTQVTYQQEGRLATEHSLLDDNADSKGTPADWYQGIRPVKKSRETEQVDGFRAHQFHLVRSEEDRQFTPAQLQQRNQLELAIHQLRSRKQSFSTEAEYFDELEKLLLQLAAVYDSVQ